MSGRTILLAAACAAALPASAMASAWPVVGGDGSRSGSAGADPGEVPVVPVWTSHDGTPRTSIVITGGGGPDVQRVAYGTTDSRLVLRKLSTGALVTAPEGLEIESGSGLVERGTWGGGTHAAAFADTSTDDRPGQLLIPHNDQNSVHIARVDLTTGERIGDDEPVSSTLGCTTATPPVVTPPDPAGGRLLYFVITGNCVANTSLVRIPIMGDATSRTSRLGRPTFAPVAASPTGAPTLVVLRSADGVARYHVAVPVTGGLSIFSTDDPLSADLPPATVAPAITAALAEPTESPQTPLAPVTEDGRLAGAEGSGTGPTPVIYVAAESPDGTRVYRFVQDGAAPHLRLTADSKPLPASGRPAPALASAETMTPSGLRAGGLLVVPSEFNLTVLRAADLAVASRLSPNPLPAGRAFRFTMPVVSGPYTYLARQGDSGTPPEQLVLRTDSLTGLAEPAFSPVPNTPPGVAYGQPAIARGTVVFGSVSGVVAYRNRDVTPPRVAVEAPSGTLGRADALAAVAEDARGVDTVSFRLAGGRTLGRDSQPDGGSAFGRGRWTLSLAALRLPAGDHEIEAVATDRAGLTTVSAARRVRVSGIGSGGLPRGACARTLPGSRKADRIRGGAAGDRIVGGAGDDRLDGGGGHDCVLGQRGDDVLAGGAGDDLLEGSSGDDVLAGGAGRNRLSGGGADDVIRGGRSRDRVTGGSGRDTILAGSGPDRVHGGPGNDTIRGEGGADVLIAGGGRNRLAGGGGDDRIFARNGRVDVIACGPGHDTVVADRADRVARDCERVSRR